MLCYAWGYTGNGVDVDLGWESMETLDDLLCSIMVAGVDNLRMRGFHRAYRQETSELPTIKGRVDVFGSSKPSVKIRKVAVCEYDEYDMDNQFNRILISTILSMHKCTEISGLRKQLSRQIPYFNDVSIIRISSASFRSLVFDRNNATYRLLMNVCELYWSDKMSAETDGNHRFRDFSDDMRMDRIFEKFLLNFYMRHRRDLKVKVDRFKWRTSGEGYPDYLEYLLTDIVIKDPVRKRMLIIDAKYYGSTLVSRHQRVSVRNSHVAQVFAYMKNHPDSGEYSTQGMLIYLLSDQEVHVTFPLEGGPITVNTIDLGKDWRIIEEELLSYLDVMDHNRSS